MKQSNQILSVKNLNISFGTTTVVKNVSFSAYEGRVHCIVGESGSGKTLSVMATMGLLPENVTSSASQIQFLDQDLCTYTEKKWQNIRGKDMAMIFQEPMTALNPLMKVGAQVAEVFEIHTKMKKKEIKKAVIDLFCKVKIPQPEEKYNAYPFELSGGQRQRVMIAMALALKPKLLIADEPTTALDATVQRDILDLIKSLQKEMNMGVLFITHDFGVVRTLADDVTVMEKGVIVEEGTVDDVLNNAQHPYTQKLLAAMPALNTDIKTYCAEETLLEIKDIHKDFSQKSNAFSLKTQKFSALNGVSLTLKKGEVLGVVGESGCGKSTLSKCIVRLEEPTKGSIFFNGVELTHLKGKALKAVRRHMQMVFQDPYSSLNPRMKVGDTISEGLRAYKLMSKEKIKPYVQMLLADVGLTADDYDKYPHQFSGGQRQRIGIARAIALKPSLIIADEAVSALDVSIQKQVLDLFVALKDKYHLSYVFVSHDLRVISQICDRVIVMKSGKIVEEGMCADIFNAPQHPYTQNLLNSIA